MRYLHFWCRQQIGKDLVIDPSTRQVFLKGKELNFTRKEFDLLFCLASNAGRVISREQLYEQVWSEDTAYDVDGLVKTHIKTLRKKLSESRTEYIKNVWGVGYRFSKEQQDGEWSPSCLTTLIPHCIFPIITLLLSWNYPNVQYNTLARKAKAALWLLLIELVLFRCSFN